MPNFPISYIVVGITVAITIITWNQGEWLTNRLMLRPYLVMRENRWYQLLSSGFIHADGTHLAFNMITLFFFGPVLERTLGTAFFLSLYISGLIVSSVPSLIRHRNNPNYASLGASGGVEAVIFSFILFYPFEKLYLFFIPIGIPAILFGVLFLAYSLFESNRQGGRINHDAHIAGAIWGVLFSIGVVPRAVDHFLTMLGLI